MYSDGGINSGSGILKQSAAIKSSSSLIFFNRHRQFLMSEMTASHSL